MTTLVFDRLGSTDHLVYHYTSASIALEKILHEMSIRLSPLNDTNDPWEGREHTEIDVGDDEDVKTTTPASVEAAFRELQGAFARVRVACLCRDLPMDEPALARSRVRSACGWARDRMWGQYADAHRGICLCFDREKLFAAFRSQLADHGDCLAGDVEYADESSERRAPNPHWNRVKALGPSKFALEFRTQNVRTRFFAKRQDWAGEREWRLVLFDDRPTGPFAFFNIHDALTAVIVGHRFSEAYRPCVQAVCARLNIPAFKISYFDRVALLPYERANDGKLVDAEGKPWA